MVHFHVMDQATWEAQIGKEFSGLYHSLPLRYAPTDGSWDPPSGLEQDRLPWTAWTLEMTSGWW